MSYSRLRNSRLATSHLPCDSAFKAPFELMRWHKPQLFSCRQEIVIQYGIIVTARWTYVHKPILFLGYNSKDTSLIAKLQKKGRTVVHTNDKISWSDEFDLVISFGYRHIISQDQINNSTAPIINLHVSYLPWNKGAHPNFWSHFDCTPSGVTIHEVDEGLTREISFIRNMSILKDWKIHLH